MPRLNIAILSTAHIHTKGFIEKLVKGTDGRKAYTIWDDVADRGKRYADSCGARFNPDLNAVLNDPQVDGFMICAENTRHFKLLEAALPIGKPVMCEKPLLTTSAEVAAVRVLLAKKPTALICGYFKPFSGEMRAISQAISQNELGTITSARYRNAHHAAYGRWFDNADLAWFTDPALAGGGAFMDMGTHAIHLLRSLFGPVEAVSATIANRSHQYPKLDDHGQAQLRFVPKGADAPMLGTVEASWIHQGGPTGLEVQGTTGAVWHDGSGYVIGKPGQPAKKVEPIEARPATVDRLIAVLQGTIPAAELAADIDACCDAVGIMEAAYRSNASGSWVSLAAARKAS